MNKKYRFIKNIFIYLILTTLSLIFILPLAWMIRSSFMELHQIFILPPEWIPKPFIIDNYVEAMTILPFGQYFKNTLIVVILSTVGVLLSSSLSAFGFSRITWSGRDKIFGIILTSMMLPGTVTLIPQFIGWKAIGFYDTLVPLIAPAYFGGAFNVFLLRQFYLTIPKELDEAAYVDGASYFQIYANVILPLSRSSLIVVGLFAFMYYWNDFFGPLIYLEKQKHFTLALGLQQFIGQYHAQWNLMMAAATVVITPVIIVFLMGQKYLIEGIALSGLKG